MNKRSAWRRVLQSWRPSSVFHSLDLALADPPLLCCDDDELCPACRAESVLTG
jgi:hypothetical protein